MTTAPERTADRYPTRGTSEVLIAREDPVVWSEPGTPGPMTATDLSAFERDGFLVLDELLAPGELPALQAELERLTTSDEVKADPRSIVEPKSNEIRSVFEVHKLSEVFAKVASDPRVVGRARQILGSDVYIHQSRINVKPGFGASGFYWHSDFETWHAEDGLAGMRTVSLSIALTENYAFNGSLMLMPGSHKTYLGCEGATPKDNYKRSLQMQDAGIPSNEALVRLSEQYGIGQWTGKAGSAVWFDCNTMHGSGDNITPYPRSNIFFVFNSVENEAVEPFAAPVRRPEYIGARDFTPVR
ncbi:ectoine hydroxylase [Streptomyces boncukensis]|uniref:Ectoine hydroxylase n=1 Tax=Streptomyces boncukensis TaxID=2711219 RepID=A0A6G4X2G8_9ACTN|nr:ectoine hydroxylase [Streptomyces boncukensis]NGO71578.1 ectoine hydroxylase [Streptomyces boncukensis]